MKLIFLTASVLFLITLTKASELEGFEDFEERNDIDQSEADDALAPKAAATSLCSIDMKALNAVINKAIDSKFQNQPVSQIFQLWTDGSRNLNIQKINGGTLQAEGKILEKIAIGSGTVAKTGAYLAYRPKYNAYHKTGLGAMFINLEKLFPCAKSAIRPICSRSTFEEDGFLKGKALIEAADSGNDLKIFGSNINTYGIAIQGCSYLNGYDGCLPKYYQVTIVCELPRACI